MRRLLLPLACVSLAACAPRSNDGPTIPPPAAMVPAPTRLTQPDVTEPPAPAPTAPGTYSSMTPPFMQHTPPRPHTLGSPPPIETPGPAGSPTIETPAPPVTRTP